MRCGFLPPFPLYTQARAVAEALEVALGATEAFASGDALFAWYEGHVAAFGGVLSRAAAPLRGAAAAAGADRLAAQVWVHMLSLETSMPA